MTATRIAQTRAVEPTATRETVSLPKTPAERQAALADAVFAAVVALQAQLAHPDAEVVREAAGMILDFEKTRIRHGQPVTGTQESFFAACDTSGMTDPAPAGRGEELEDGPDEHEPSEEAVERMRARLQRRADERGTGEQVSWERAYRATEQHIAYRRQAAGCG